jgi:Flp pilus assembly protein TadG
MSGRKGTALIEFAGSLVLISTVFTGVFQLGQSFYTYNRLVNAVRQGARFASRQPEASAGNGAVQRLIVYGETDPGADAAPVIRGLNERNVQVIVADHKATVVIRDFALPGMFSSTTLDGKPSVTFPFSERAK